MKKIMMSLLALSLVVAVKAQEIPDRKADMPRMRHRMEMRRHHEMALKDLNLSDEQKERFKIEKESFKKQMDELKKNDGITVKEWRSRMETLRKDHQSHVQGILTPDQKAQLEKRREEGRVRQEDMMRKRSQMMKEKLGLTDEQAAKMDKNHQEMREKMKSIREDKSLSEDKKREEMKELMKGQKEKMKSILTEEQMKKLQEGRKHREERDKRGDRRPDDKKEI
jgi:Spy/CpxP family protein refolding chaperone